MQEASAHAIHSHSFVVIYRMKICCNIPDENIPDENMLFSEVTTFFFSEVELFSEVHCLAPYHENINIYPLQLYPLCFAGTLYTIPHFLSVMKIVLLQAINRRSLQKLKQFFDR